MIETLGFRSLGARDLGHSLRLPLSPFAADWIAARIRALRDAIGLPVWLQLATAGFDASSNALCEFEFLERIAEQTDCEFILDVSDITRLTQQSGLDERAAMQQLARLPIVSLTLSGELESAWPTLAMALEAMTPRMIVVRRTETLFPLDAIGETLRRAKSMLKDRPEPAVATTRSGVAPALLDHDAAAALRLWQSSVIDELASGTADRRPGGVSGWDNWRLRIAEIHKGHEIKKFLSST